MSISDDEFRRWLRQDNRADRVCTIEIDHQVEIGGEPATSTLLVSDKPYRRGAVVHNAIFIALRRR